MPKPFVKADFKPAVRDPKTGQVYTGPSHMEALIKAQKAGMKTLGSQLDPAHTGFLRKDGTFYTRAETEREFGFRTSADLR